MSPRSTTVESWRAAAAFIALFWLWTCLDLGSVGRLEVASAQEFPAQSQTEKLARPLLAWQASLDRIEKALSNPLIPDKELGELRDELDGLQAKAAAFVDKHRPRFEEAKAQLMRLTPEAAKKARTKPADKPEASGKATDTAPRPDEPEPESAASGRNGSGSKPGQRDPFAKERDKLTGLVQLLGGAVKTASVLEARARSLDTRAQAILRNRFSRKLFERTRAPLSPALWIDVFRDARSSFANLTSLVSDWIDGLSSPRPLILTLLCAIVVYLLLRRGCGLWVGRLRYAARPGEIDFFNRAGTAVWVTGLRTLPLAGTAATIFVGLVSFADPPDEIRVVLTESCLMIAGVGLVIALSATVFAPARPQWRILPASNEGAKRLNRLIAAIAVLYATNAILGRLNEVLLAPVTLMIGQSSVITLIFAILLIAILRTPTQGGADEHKIERPGWLGWLRLPLWAIVIAILAASATGYIVLARFLAGQVVVTGSIVVLLYLLYITIDEFCDGMVNPKSVIGRRLRAKLSISRPRAEQFSLLTLLLLNLLLATIGIPLLLLQWGFSWDDVEGWLSAAYFGFQLGNLRISLATILLGSFIFILGLVFARLFSGWLDRRILSRARLDRGLRHSIRTGIGYLGIILAFIVAVSYAGANFSDLALVAGALSVGIGFGLQNIVNNFVSGIILLAERPIKVGDWIVVGNEEGYVRRINVRATEIETFERSNVIIPNSSLIGGQVKNWMLRSPIGRITIPVGVSYEADAEQVHDLLLDLARSHEQVLDDPPPNVKFMDFGASSLDFSLRAYIQNVDQSLSVRSDLRFAILKAFREAGIEIPFPQQDLHLKDIDRLAPVRRGTGGTRSRRKPSTG